MKMTAKHSLMAFIVSIACSANAYAAPPALTTASFMKHEFSFDQCQKRTKEIMGKMNLEIDDRGNGTIGGFGEQSIAIVNCHRLADATYVQIAVSSQKQEAAELIMNYLTGYLRSSIDSQAVNPTAQPSVAYPQ
jgi:hypothetical protein